jgi:hypothetical protein
VRSDSRKEAIAMNSLRLIVASTAGALLLVACGGGDSSNADSPPDNPPTFSPVSDGGLTLSETGVQVYGKSTSDQQPDRDPTTATGMQLSDPEQDNGSAEIRVTRDETGAMTAVTMILRNLGVSWDGTAERPPIVETFNQTPGRTVLAEDGQATSIPLPAATDLAFWDGATQANYANNRHFPADEAPTCPPWWGAGESCNLETFGITNGSPGTDWRVGGAIPDNVRAVRLHNDGDIDAPAVPFPGSKGYRALELWAYQYAAMGAWVAQETTLMLEWGAPPGEEHNVIRRGLVATGEVTPAGELPEAGIATYEDGFVYGWYAANETDEQIAFRGRATVSVDFGTNAVSVQVSELRNENDSELIGVAIDAEGSLGGDEAGRNAILVQIASNGMAGRLGARMFGPVDAGEGGTGPAEIGGTFRLGNGGASAMGSFIALRRAPR